jgi:hypothetical protein
MCDSKIVAAVAAAVAAALVPTESCLPWSHHLLVSLLLRPSLALVHPHVVTTAQNPQRLNLAASVEAAAVLLLALLLMAPAASPHRMHAVADSYSAHESVARALPDSATAPLDSGKTARYHLHHWRARVRPFV